MVGLLKKAGLAVLFLVVLSACDKSTFDNERSADQGSLVARLHTLPGASKAATAELEAPAIEDFVVAVRSAEAPAEPVYTSLFSEFPYSLNLTKGSYTIEAAHGQNVPFTTEDPYYFISESFEIEQGAATSVELTARLVGFGVEGVFDADMGDYFASWQLEAEIDDVWNESYRWAEEGNKPRAYFLPGTVQVILRGVRHNGELFSQVIKEISSPLGRELYTLNIHVLPAGHALSVRVDTERRVVTDQGVVSVDALPDLEAPTLGAMTFYETTTVPAEGLAATAELHSFVGFAEVEITVPRAGYGLEARAYRWSDGADREVLRAAGVDLGADDLSNSRTATLSAKGLVGAMLADASVEREYNLAVAVTDGTGKVGVSTLPILIERPEFTLPAIGAAACWTKRVEVPNVNVIDGKGDALGMERHADFSYQISSDGGATWSDFSRTELAAVGLTPDTEYHFRTRFRDLIGTAVAAKTEAVVQIPNSDFESWQEDKSGAGNDGQPFFRWAKEGAEWWGSLNGLTCAKVGVNSWCVAQSSTRPTGGRLGHGVLVNTAGYGSGNTWLGFSAAIVYKITAGRLFLGAYDGGQKNGQAFASRPTAMTYWYKWAKHPDQADQTKTSIWVENRTGSVVTRLGEGVFATSTNVGNFTQKRIEITYTNTTLAPTHLCVEFQSGQNEDEKKYLYDRTREGNYTNTYYYYGSQLWVDDVELIYDK